MPADSETRRRARRRPGNACRCENGPTLVVTFRRPHPKADAQVSSVRLFHFNVKDGCPIEHELIAPATWLRTVGQTARRLDTTATRPV